jgi:hypothetical protein
VACGKVVKDGVLQMKLKHTVTLTLYTEADFDTKYCLDDCPMSNMEGYPHDCDLLKCDLDLVHTEKPGEEINLKCVRDPRCPWKCEGVVNET